MRSRDTSKRINMSRYRTPSKRSAYYIPKEDYLTAIHWCRRYPNWIKELKVEPDTSKAITYDLRRLRSHDRDSDAQGRDIR